jgi:hypothetical protein
MEGASWGLASVATMETLVPGVVEVICLRLPLMRMADLAAGKVEMRGKATVMLGFGARLLGGM